MQVALRRGPRGAVPPSTSGDSPPAPTLAWVRRNSWVLPALAAPVLLATSLGRVSSVSVYLPTAALDLSYSFVRMVFAYGISLGFAITYGYFAAVNRTGERILLPILDILQSIPILGFFPFVLVIFVSLTPGNSFGANIAAIFLIFTSMAWNLAFGVYESLKGVPGDLKEASDSFGVRGRQRWRELVIPATVNRLVYNSVLSWTAGWYYLVSAELISTGGGPSTTLPGIGSFLIGSIGNTDALIAGVVLLAALIALLDFFVWRPAGRLAERFRYDTAPSGEEEAFVVPRRTAPLRRAARIVTRGVREGYTIIRTPFSTIAAYARGGAPPRPAPRLKSAAHYVGIGTGLVLLWLLLIVIVIGAYDVFTGRISPSVNAQIASIPLALGSSLARLVAAYLLCLAISLPLATYLARHARTSRFALPVVEVVASFPATAFFPLIIFGLVAYFSPEGASIFLVITGMIWYLFFNILSGVRQIPPDLEEASRSLGTKRFQYYRQVLLPAITPALITGSITAWGGGWNSLILAEYLPSPSNPAVPIFHTLGIGELIDAGNFASGGIGLPLMAASLLTMVVAVVTLNEVLWKPLYRRSIERYRYD